MVRRARRAAVQRLAGETAAFSPGGSHIVSLDRERRVRVYETASGALQWTSAPVAVGAYGCAFFSRDGSQVLVSRGLQEPPFLEEVDLRRFFHFLSAETGGPVLEPAPPLPSAWRYVTQRHHVGW